MGNIINNSRSQKTRKALRESFSLLLEQRNISEITIRELTDLAGVNRGTFYLHYKDIYDLHDRIESEIFDEISIVTDNYVLNNETFEPYPGLVSYLNYISDNAAVCRMLLNHNHTFIDKICMITEKKILVNWLDMLATEKNRHTLHYYSKFVVHGFTSIIIDWLNRGMPDPPDQLAVIMGSIADHGLDAFEKSLQQKK